MTKWDEQFAPVLAQGREVREGQRILGNAIIEVVEKGGNLIAEASTGTGKSLAALVPIITKVLEAQKKQTSYRGVVSTETLILQNQIFLKDLPFLTGLYPGFTFAKLMGRSNYLCLENAKLNKVGVKSLDTLVEKLKGRWDSIGDGEQSDVERVIGRKLLKEEWEKISGSATFCADNQCTAEKCHSAKARKRAKTADIVVINHAVLATDLEMRLGATTEAAEDGLLGSFEALVVDEGHQLEPVLVSQWTKELSMWELDKMSGDVAVGIENGQQAVSDHGIGRITQTALDDIQEVLLNIQKFFTLLAERDGQEWKGHSAAVCMKYIAGNVTPNVVSAMNEYEQENPIRLANAETTLEKAITYLTKALVVAKDLKIKGVPRKISKGARAAKDLLDIVRILSKAMETKDGIISQYGIYGTIVDGWEKRNGEQGMTLRMVPLDVSPKAKYLWHTKSNVLLSATLTDLTDGSFRYAKECVGFPAAKEVKVSTPFELATQQLIYITPASDTPVQELKGAQFNLDEMVSLVNASRGRSLVLFTSRAELDWTVDELKLKQMNGLFNYPILVQEKDSDKAALMDQFKSDTSSVLLATKSFFVGIDVPGESLSQVILAKFPLPRYSVECRQQISHWRKRNFPRWYERESLTILQQAAGRLIRSSDCRGVVSILDYRASDAKSSVYKTTKIGVDALGSPVTIDINAVANFFAPTV